MEYMVKWKNIPIEDNSWISQSELDAAQIILAKLFKE